MPNRKQNSIDDITPAEWNNLNSKGKTSYVDPYDSVAINTKVNNPPHYNNGNIECIDYIIDNMGREGASYYCEGNVKKYIHRWRYKDASPIDDLRKARWYLDKLIELQL